MTTSDSPSAGLSPLSSLCLQTWLSVALAVASCLLNLTLRKFSPFICSLSSTQVERLSPSLYDCTCKEFLTCSPCSHSPPQLAIGTARLLSGTHPYDALLPLGALLPSTNAPLRFHRCENFLRGADHRQLRKHSLPQHLPRKYAVHHKQQQKLDKDAQILQKIQHVIMMDQLI